MEKNEELSLVRDALDTVLSGGTLDEGTLYSLADIESEEGTEALLDGAREITAKFVPRKFDTCSIVNARSGRCPENCKWCAQSAHYNTHCDTYELVDTEAAMKAAKDNATLGIGRYSLVASGRSVKGRALDAICKLLADVRAAQGTETCASLGLLSEDELRKLHAAGVNRYHCNLETAPSMFPELCTTHTQADKMETIRAARRIGMEVCCGGIIGMGETRRQRVEFAVKLREVKPCSIPINILSPIPGTPLESTPLIAEDEIIRTVALFRFAHPHAQIRFAGGRARLSRQGQKRALEVGINGAIVGDMLTTLGASVAQDKELVKEAGYQW